METARRSTGDNAAASKVTCVLSLGGNEMSSRELSDSNKGLHHHFLTIQCPHCEVRWLAPGVKHGDTYVCKECCLSFVVRKPKKQTSKPSSLGISLT